MTSQTPSSRTAASAQVRRFPRALYAQGADPDPRFSLANERTFLAWLRTSMALMAAGVALHAFDLRIWSLPQFSASLLLVGLGVVASINGWCAWLRAELALRQRRPVPSPMLALPVAIGVSAAGVLVVIGLLLA